jgi:hypothetical protein
MYVLPHSSTGQRYPIVSSFSCDFFVFAFTFFLICSRVERVRNIPAFEVSASITSSTFCRPAHHESQEANIERRRQQRQAAAWALPAWPLSVAGQHFTARLYRCIPIPPLSAGQLGSASQCRCWKSFTNFLITGACHLFHFNDFI